MAWTPDCELLVAFDWGLKLYHTQGQEMLLPSALFGIQGEVRSVAIHDRMKNIAVLFDREAHPNLYVTSLGIGRKQTRQNILPDGCMCVRFTLGGDLLVGGTKNMLIKYNFNMRKKWQRSTKHTAEFIAVSEDKILICGDNQMSVLSPDGQMLSSFPASSDTHMLSVRQGVCIDSSGTVYVADHKAVIMFNADGRYMRNLLDVKENSVITKLALTCTKYLALGEYNLEDSGTNIKIYEL